MADATVVFATELDTSGLKEGLQKVGDQEFGAGKTGSILAEAGNKLGSIIGLAAAKSIAQAIGKTGIAFDAAISQVAATMGKTVSDIHPLVELAELSGRTTKFTAIEAAEALNYMALAGWDAETIIKGFPDMLNLAAAGNMSLAYASDIVTDGLTAMGLSADDAKRFVDEMAKTASKSNTNVQQLGESILTVGGTARVLEGGTTELNTVLGLLADNGIKASMSGTQLRNIILSLAAPIDKAQDALDALGVSAYDADGNFRPLLDIFSDLNGALSGMTEEDRTRFTDQIFNREDMKGVNALLGTTVERWKSLEGYIKDANGAAEQMAAVQLDNLGGDITLFKSAWDGLKLSLYQPFKDEAREATQAATDFVSKATESIGLVQQAYQEISWQEYFNNLNTEVWLGPASDFLISQEDQEKLSVEDFFEIFIPEAGAAELPPQVSQMANQIAGQTRQELLEAFQNGQISYDELVAAAFGSGGEVVTDPAVSVVEGGEGEGDGEANPLAMRLIQSITMGIEANASLIKTSLQTALDNAKSSANTSGFNGVGLQISYGIAAGIRAGTGAVAAAVISVVEAALRAAEKAAKIKSPSRLFRDRIGAMLSAGVAQGVENDAYLVRKAVNEMVLDSMPNMRSIGARASSVVNGAYDGNSALLAARSGPFNQTNNFNVPVQTPDEFATTMHMYATYGLAAKG